MLVLLKTAYDEDWSVYSPAFLLREDIVRQLYSAGTVRSYEFYGPLMEYQLRWTRNIRTLYHLTCFRHQWVRSARNFAKRMRNHQPRHAIPNTNGIGVSLVSTIHDNGFPVLQEPLFSPTDLNVSWRSAANRRYAVLRFLLGAERPFSWLARLRDPARPEDTGPRLSLHRRDRTNRALRRGSGILRDSPKLRAGLVGSGNENPGQCPRHHGSPLFWLPLRYGEVLRSEQTTQSLSN